MKHQRKRVCKIVDELMTYLYAKGANDITINVKEDEYQFRMSFKSNFTEFSQGDIDRLVQRLNLQRQVAMEEYFWELTGDNDVDTELELVGMMTDKAEVTLGKNTIEIILYRYK